MESRIDRTALILLAINNDFVRQEELDDEHTVLCLDTDPASHTIPYC